MSSYVLSRVLSLPAAQFQEHTDAAASDEPLYELAELNTLLTGLPAADLEEAVAAPQRWPNKPGWIPTGSMTL